MQDYAEILGIRFYMKKKYQKKLYLLLRHLPIRLLIAKYLKQIMQ